MRLELSLSSLSQITDLGRGGRRKGNALPYSFVCRAHGTIMHHNGANVQMRGMSREFREDENLKGALRDGHPPDTSEGDREPLLL
jgi:hypothetical protein